MGRIRAFAAFATALVAVLGAACTSSPTGPGRASSDPVSTSGSPPTPTPSVSGSAPSSTPPPMTISNPGPPHATQPTLPPDVPTTGPNTRPGEKPPAMPLEATQHTARGARAFAAFFIKTIDWGYATTSSAYMRHYFDTKTCVACRSILLGLDRARAKRRHFVGDRFTVRRLTNPRFKVSGTIALLSVVFDVTRGRTVDHDGRQVASAPALSEYREDVNLQWRRSHWIVVIMVPRG